MISPLGTSPAGLGAPVASGALYQQTTWTKSSTGAVSSTQIDPITRDVVYDANGSENGMSDTAQRVYMLVTTTLGSRANFQSMGFQRPGQMGDGFQRAVEDAVRQALAPAVDSVRLDAVTVETDPNYPTRGFALVQWFDLRRQSKQTTKAPLQF